MDELIINKTANSRLKDFDQHNIKFAKIYSDHMFQAQYRKGSWGNPTIKEYSSIMLSPATAALHYGQSVFEGIKAYKRDKHIIIFRPEDNFERLNKSLDRMMMPKLSKDMFFKALDNLMILDNQWVPTTPGSALYIRPFVFADDEYIGVKVSENYRFMIFTCPVGSYYDKPLRIKFEDRYGRCCKGGTGYAKASGNYAATYKAMNEAQFAGFDQIIWTDAENHQEIEECGTMNVMFVIDGILITPALKDTILAGITRDSILTVARDLGYPVEERAITVNEIKDALEQNRVDDAFGTGTAAVITHFSHLHIDRKEYELPRTQDREISNEIKSTLHQIRKGEIEDRHQWLHKVLYDF